MHPSGASSRRLNSQSYVSARGRIQTPDMTYTIQYTHLLYWRRRWRITKLCYGQLLDSGWATEEGTTKTTWRQKNDKKSSLNWPHLLHHQENPSLRAFWRPASWWWHVECDAWAWEKNNLVPQSCTDEKIVFVVVVELWLVSSKQQLINKNRGGIFFSSLSQLSHLSFSQSSNHVLFAQSITPPS